MEGTAFFFLVHLLVLSLAPFGGRNHGHAQAFFVIRGEGGVKSCGRQALFQGRHCFCPTPTRGGGVQSRRQAPNRKPLPQAYPPPPPCISYANVRNYYGPYTHCSLDKGVACAQHTNMRAHGMSAP